MLITSWHMRSSISVPDSPEEHAPSTWQTRFGKQKPSLPGENIRDRQSHSQQQLGPESPSIADQLLSALNARERQRQQHLEPEEKLSRQCADQLLGGKRNAFVPELHANQFLYQDDNFDGGQQQAGDSMVNAREIINRRFQIENQVEALRQHKNKPGSAKAREVLAAKPRNRNSTTDTKAQRKPVSDRANGLQYTRTKLFELGELSKATTRGPVQTENAARVKIASRHRTSSSSNSWNQPTCSDNNGRETRDRVHRSRQPEDRSRATTSSTTVSGDPIKQMEERQQRLRETRAVKAANQQARPATTSSSNTSKTSKRLGPTTVDTVCDTSNSDGCVDRSRNFACSTRDERLVQERIERLVSENQRTMELQEQQRIKQHAQRLKVCVFAAWKHQSDARKLQETRVKQVFEWRLVQSVWRNWKRFAQSMAVKRVEMKTRARLVRETQVEAQADAFVRQKQLPKWFFRWLASVRAQREAKELETAQQASNGEEEAPKQRHVSGPKDNKLEIEVQAKDDVKPVVHSGHAGRISIAILTKPRAPQPKAAWSSEEPPGPSSSSSPLPASSSPTQSSYLSSRRSAKAPLPSMDPLYVSIQERAAERKQRRDQLRQKYELLELEKREATAMQLAKREALLLQQKLDERERIRERKRQEALVAYKKMPRIEAFEAQRRQAKRHDYKRLVFYYGFLSLKRQWEFSKRIAANATEWHQLRVLHSNWHNWLEFVHAQHIERQQVERQKLAVAAHHHSTTLKRQSFQRFKWLRQRVLSAELAIKRQRQWNLMKRSWGYWQRAFTVSRMQQQAQQREAEGRLNESRLRRVWLQWRVQVAGLREERELQQEKQRMWAKVRGWLNE